MLPFCVSGPRINPHRKLTNVGKTSSYDQIIDIETKSHQPTHFKMGLNGKSAQTFVRRPRPSTAERNEKFEAIKRQMTEGQSGVDVLLKTINNEAMTDLTGTPMYMSPEQYRFTYSYPGKYFLCMFYFLRRIFQKH